MSQNGKIILRNVGLSYGKENIYDNFNAVFPQGVNVILGRSGSGKTTLLNIIAGLISYSGECVSDKAAVVFSEPALAPVSVENNVRMVLKKTDCGAVDEALKLARIEDKRKQNALTLSDGEKQRVALARAFASKRKVLLLDEPFVRLDYGVKRRLHDTLINYLQTSAATVVMVTHDVDEALTLADRIYFLDGRPCCLTETASLSMPPSKRDIYSVEYEALRRKVLNLF